MLAASGYNTSAPNRMLEMDGMKFGLFFQFQVPRPWHARKEYEVFRNAIDQAALAEQVGFDYTWVAEHHFLEEVSHAGASDLLLAAMAEHTSTMRLGLGVVLMSSPLNHPLRVAERVATLDVLSNGRVEFGTGRSSTPYQLTPFGIDFSETRAMWEEALEIIPKMWMQETFEHQGRYYTIPPRNVIPKPLQQPHPPLWLACIQPETATLAGRKGLGALLMTFMGPEPVAERVDLYRKALENAEPVGAEVNDRLALFAFAFCGERDAETRELAGPEALWYRETLGEIFSREWERHDTVPDSYQYHARVHSRGEQARRGDYNSYIDSGAFCMGDPDACIRIIERYAALKPEQFVMIMQAGNLPHEKIMESIRLFGKHVLPEFKRR